MESKLFVFPLSKRLKTITRDGSDGWFENLRVHAGGLAFQIPEIILGEVTGLSWFVCWDWDWGLVDKVTMVIRYLYCKTRVNKNTVRQKQTMYYLCLACCTKRPRIVLGFFFLKKPKKRFCFSLFSFVFILY